MKTRLLKRLRKNAKKNVFLSISQYGEFVVKSDIGLYIKGPGLEIYFFSKKFRNNVVFSMTLHEAEKILSDARRLYMRNQLKKLKIKKYQKIVKKL